MSGLDVHRILTHSLAGQQSLSWGVRQWRSAVRDLASLGGNTHKSVVGAGLPQSSGHRNLLIGLHSFFVHRLTAGKCFRKGAYGLLHRQIVADSNFRLASAISPRSRLTVLICREIKVAFLVGRGL